MKSGSYEATLSSLPPRILVASSRGEQKKLVWGVGPLPFLSELNDLARWLCMIINLRGAGAHTAWHRRNPRWIHPDYRMR